MAPRARNGQASSRNILYVCRTCPRYEPGPAGGGRTRGASLAAAVKELASNGRVSDSLKVLVVNCLSGCPSPCNASLGGPGKLRIRFSRLGPEHASDLLDAAESYAATGDGDLSPDHLPESLRAKLTARTPGAAKPRAQFAGRRF